MASALAASGSAAAIRASRAASPAGVERLGGIGVGLFTIPKLLEEDFAGAMKMLGEIGYDEAEFFGPYPFSPPQTHEDFKQIAGFLGLTKTAFYGLTTAQVKAILDENGLSSPSMHVDLPTMRQRLAEAAEGAHVLGQQYVIVPFLPASERSDLDAYKRLADEFNDFGRRAQAVGLRFAYHNHGFEMGEMDGQIPYDVLLERTDPALVDMEMDVFWMIAGGGDPVAYFDAYPGRFRLVHIKGMAEPVRFKDPANAFENGELMAAGAQMADVGAGVLDFKTILTHARKSGVAHFLVERDLAPSPRKTLEASYLYLAALDFNG